MPRIEDGEPWTRNPSIQVSLANMTLAILAATPFNVCIPDIDHVFFVKTRHYKPQSNYKPLEVSEVEDEIKRDRRSTGPGAHHHPHCGMILT